jgi:hypothetical protein
VGDAVAILAVVGVQVALPESLTFGPNLLLPSVELVLLAVVLAANPNRPTTESRDMRLVSIVLIGVIGAANAVSLGLLVDSLLKGAATSGRLLVLAALGIWLTNVVVFALVYWELDRRGPHARIAGEQVNPELLPANVAEPPALRVVGTGVRGLPVREFTNSTAFSPTDTMPLSRRIKMAMLVQSLLSLLTIGLVGARAVNILS